MSRELVGRRSVAVNVTSASWTLGNTAGTYKPIGIFCNAASTITGALCGDTTETAWILPAGYAPLSFRAINTSSATKSGMHIIFGE